MQPFIGCFSMKRQGKVVRAYHRNKGWLKESVNRSSYKRWPSDIVRADVRTGFHVSSETGRDLKRGGHLTVNLCRPRKDVSGLRAIPSDALTLSVFGCGALKGDLLIFLVRGG
ncbi:hypothetical protein PLICRDRAFT_179328 [Plicaturopsis crispa FD-325 SS-3]|uniref:Uncharacterized protein n=1 Tax=Plicaturopsis crispa FD-325 SS-3 TaxID=944288 RepID=A0A0C9SKX6_PLICR|nr:hypothetical protein PLICRDRAFT_179328 [Plicaturopsis crispa FD-325 SS-3]